MAQFSDSDGFGARHTYGLHSNSAHRFTGRVAGPDRTTEKGASGAGRSGSEDGSPVDDQRAESVSRRSARAESVSRRAVPDIFGLKLRAFLILALVFNPDH